MSHPDQIFEQITAWDQNVVRKAKIMVVGAGALGNEVLKNLALLNVGNIIIVDFDRVEKSNLSRSVLFRTEDADSARFKAHVAAERLLEINPDLSIQTLIGDVATDLSIGLIHQVDVVIACLDNRLARLYINRLCWRAGRPWVDGGILNLSGQVASYFPEESCYECTLTQSAWNEIRQRQGCTDMARRYAFDGQAVTTPIAASIAGALQAQEALRIVMGQKENGLNGRMLNFEGMQNHFAIYEFAGIKENCESHYQYSHLIDAQSLSCNSTLLETLDWIRENLGFEHPEIQLDHSIATSLAGMITGQEIKLTIPIQHFSDAIAAELGKSSNEIVAIPQGAMCAKLDDKNEFLNLPLWRFGIPPGHVLRIGRGNSRRFLSLSADLPTFSFEQGIKHLENPWNNMTVARLLTEF